MKIKIMIMILLINSTNSYSEIKSDSFNDCIQKATKAGDRDVKNKCLKLHEKKVNGKTIDNPAMKKAKQRITQGERLKQQLK